MHIPLVDNPTTFTCDQNTSLSGTYTSISWSEADCNTTAQAWLTDFAKNDTPSTQEAIDGLAHINAIRNSMGLPSFHYDSLLESASLKHEDYIGDVYAQYNVWIAHYENNIDYPSAFYGGINVYNRANAMGYTGTFVGEVISFNSLNTVTTSLDELMSAIYHRNILIWSDSNEIGLGGTNRNFAFASQPHLVGRKNYKADFLRAITAREIINPFDGQTNVTRQFAEEIPDPLPNTSLSGYPVSLYFNDYYINNVAVTSFKLYVDATNVEVTNVLLMDKLNDPNNELTDHQFVLFPLDVLSGSTVYRVEASWVEDGVNNSKIWRFTTRP